MRDILCVCLSCYLSFGVSGVYIYKANESPGYPTGHYTNAGFLLVGALAVLGLRVMYVQRNKNLEPGARRWRL